MRIIKPQFFFENPEEVDQDLVIQRLERYGRTCYKSEDRITPESAKGFVEMILERGHVSVLEHEKVTVRVVCDRGVTHEWVRHRIGSYAQESTRFCNYSKGKYGGEITVINPLFFPEDANRRQNIGIPDLVEVFDTKGASVTSTIKPANAFDVWWLAMYVSEWAYMKLIEEFGRQPQEARSVLPNSLKTEIVASFNIRQWRHFFRLRTAKAAHPQMREITIPLLREFKEHLPILFEDIPLPEN